MPEHSTPPTRIAFVCVQNAGRSQMAYAFAQAALERRGLTERYELLTGGTQPAARVHPPVVETMAAVGFDLTGRSPREVTADELTQCDYVITMGCSAAAVCPAGWGGENRDWGLADPDGKPPEAVAEIRDEVQHRVDALLDELEGV